MPAVGPVVASVPIFSLEGLARACGVHPELQAAFEVLRVEDRLPVPVPSRFLAGEVEPAAVDVIDLAVGPADPDDLGHRLGEESEPLLGPDPFRLGPPSFEVGPVEHVGAPADAGDEDRDDQAHPDGRGISLVEQLGLASEDHQAVEDDRREDRHGKQASGHLAARPVAGDRHHQATAGPGHERPRGERQHPQRGMQCHLLEGRPPHEYPDPVEISDQRRARDQRAANRARPWEARSSLSAAIMANASPTIRKLNAVAGCIRPE